MPGGHVFIAANPLLSHLVYAALVESGFEKRGEIIRLVQTLRGGDRPKNAHDEFADVTVMPRSGWEPWGLFRKPCEGRVQDNLRVWKTGGLKRISAEHPFGDVIRSALPGRRNATSRRIPPSSHRALCAKSCARPCRWARGSCSTPSWAGVRPSLPRVQWVMRVLALRAIPRFRDRKSRNSAIGHAGGQRRKVSRHREPGSSQACSAEDAYGSARMARWRPMPTSGSR